MIRITFERSEACAESHNLPPTTRTVDFDDSDGQWVQFTYDSLRTQDGAPLAAIGGPEEGCDCWWIDDEPFSDVIVEFTPAAA